MSASGIAASAESAASDLAQLEAAATAGSVEHGYRPGMALVECGRVEDAQIWYRRTAEQGQPGAMLQLGRVLL